jgi:hypothetical protein
MHCQGSNVAQTHRDASHAQPNAPFGSTSTPHTFTSRNSARRRALLRLCDP